MYWEGKVIIPNIGNKGLQDVLTLDAVISLIALFHSVTLPLTTPQCTHSEPIHYKNRTYIFLCMPSGLRMLMYGKRNFYTVGRTQWIVCHLGVHTCGLPLCVPATINPATVESTNRDGPLLPRWLSLCYKMWLSPPNGSNHLRQTSFSVIVRTVIDSKTVF